MTNVAQLKTAPEKAARLSPEDRSRMQRLYEEVESRLQEMASIGTRAVVEKNPDFAKALRKETGKGTLLFEPVHKQPAKGALGMKLDMQGIEIICYASGCVAYDYDLGICYVVN